MADYLIGIDVGSSACKCLITDDTGRAIAEYSQPYPTCRPRDGWAEQDPQDWYHSTCSAIRRCLEASRIAPQRIIGIAVAGPAHSVALMDDSGAILHPTIHWSDLRCAAQCERLEAARGDDIFAASLCRLNPAWTLPQLLWLREERPSVYRRLRRILVVKDYVRYRLTGGYQTDVYDAIGTQLYDVRRGDWSDDLAGLVGFQREWLPEVLPATAVSGRVTPSAARDTGLLAGTPVALGSGDSVVEAAGIGAIQAGHCILKLGTAANVNLVMRQAHPAAGAINYRHIVESLWFAITATNAGASTADWFGETFLRPIAADPATQAAPTFARVEALAADSPPGANGLLFHPYLHGERSPYWDPHLRGDFVGIGRRHRLEDFARAVLEGVAFSLRDCLDLVKTFGEPITNRHLIGGGAKSKIWSQIVCDVIGQTLSKPAVQSAAFGSAVLAGIAVGLFQGWPQALAACAPTSDVLRPRAGLRRLYNEQYAVYKEVARDLRGHDRRLGQIIADEEL